MRRRDEPGQAAPAPGEQKCPAPGCERARADERRRSSIWRCRSTSWSLERVRRARSGGAPACESTSPSRGNASVRSYGRRATSGACKERVKVRRRGAAARQRRCPGAALLRSTSGRPTGNGPTNCARNCPPARPHARQPAGTAGASAVRASQAEARAASQDWRCRIGIAGGLAGWPADWRKRDWRRRCRARAGVADIWRARTNPPAAVALGALTHAIDRKCGRT